MSAALASIVSANHGAPSLTEHVDRVLAGAAVDGNGETPWLQSARTLAKQAFLERQPDSLQEAHHVLRRLYDLQLAPAHAPEAEHQYDTRLMVIRAELERAWMQSELATVSASRMAPGHAATVIRGAWHAHPSFNHPIFDFMEREASREQNRADDESIMEDRVILDGFEIDFWSDRARQVQGGSSVCCRPAMRITKTERIEIIRTLFDALQGIRILSPSIYELVRTYARVIIIRNSDDGGGSSEQVSDHIGEIRILNVKSYSHHSLMNAIVHESVHSFLGTFESVEFAFTNEFATSDLNLKPVSLWSGRMLAPQAFIHAIFVYFSLIHFIKLEIDNSQDAVVREELSNELTGLVSGFLYPGKISQYVTYTCAVDSRIARCLDYMQVIIQADANCLVA